MPNELSPQAIMLMNRIAEVLSMNPSDESPWVQENVQVIYTNPQHPSGLWSMRGEKENEFIDCPSDRLKGKISKLWYTEKEPGMIRWYLRLECVGDRSFIIQSSHDRGFSRSMLAAISMMSAEDVQKELVIQCTAWEAKNGSMQFCTIYTSDRKLDPPRIEAESIGAIARIAQTVVADACGYEYRLSEPHKPQPESQPGPAKPDDDGIPF
ncbi:MAG: hypothetical protein DCF15_13915 [Phormidesmis priestleyi]|uniref:Uncharacterized protein n=1 Tax=Phormidesmis priestleyi TaxID=268141 RepID=A0A2W4YZZ6_9CYAN|nr:MAG: hypothetical protein DCF15_13915 [Phormidesmis priestleyi]